MNKFSKFRSQLNLNDLPEFDINEEVSKIEAAGIEVVVEKTASGIERVVPKIEKPKVTYAFVRECLDKGLPSPLSKEFLLHVDPNGDIVEPEPKEEHKCCDRCDGTGHEEIRLGEFAGKQSRCPSCKGKGFMTKDDFKRREYAAAMRSMGRAKRKNNDLNDFIAAK